ncbi:MULTISPECIES: hypothetical protein [Brevundimonas]|jgi:hypothetical protein|nr:MULTISPECIES: hypothetical protein [Brevundimonas]
MNTDLLLDRFFAMMAVAALTFVVGGMILNWLTRPPRPPKGP